MPDPVTGQALSDPEVIHSSERTLVRRRRDDGRPVIVKQTLGPTAVRRAEHERTLLNRLAGIEGVPRLLPDRSEDTLVTQDSGGTVLADLLIGRGPDPVLALTLARGLAAVLSAVHRAGVIHRDLNPANILVGPAPGPQADGPVPTTIIDFDLATTFAQIRPDFVDTGAIVGRLPYLAPEQTGRTGLPIDVRTDLYALGAVVYEVATGATPFEEHDALRAIADILARVPVPARERNPAVPERLSRILSRLLEKEPDARYQSAEGLAHDLGPAGRDLPAEGELGTRDFPSQLSAPSRLIGREPELRILTDALEATGRPGAGIQCLLVSGAPGVGKSALIGQLRPLVNARGGWFVSGKADQFRSGSQTSVFTQSMTALGQLVLALPESEVGPIRNRMKTFLGDNAGVVASLFPLFQTLLGAPDERWLETDPAAIRARAARTAPELLRSVMSSSRPLVLFLDDLQWAGHSLDVVDTLMADPGLDGLVLVAAYREEEVDAAHPLTALTQRWDRLGHPVRRLRLGNLPPDATGRLVAEILRTPVAECAPLAEKLVDRTGGNPYETVEFVNALRRDGALALGPDGWTWDTDAVHRHLGSGNLIHLLTKRLRALPSRTLRMLQTLSCLGAEVEMSTLALIGDDTVGEVAERIRPALEEGLVVSVDAGDSGTVGAISTIVFRHDRVQQAAHDSLTEDERRDLMLSLARTMARHGRGPDAAQLYLEVVDQIGEPGEQRRVVGLFQAAAEATRRTFNPRLVRRYVEAAADLHRRAGGQAADPTGVALDIALHAALCDLGRMTETDAVFDRIRSAVPDPVELVPVVGLQMSGLAGRALHRECVELGLDQLGQLGWPAPDGPGNLDQAVRRSYDEIERWFEAGEAEQDAGREEPADPRTRAAAALVARLCPATFAVDQRLMSWLVTIGWRLWVGAGPLPDLVTCLSHSNSWSRGLRENGRLDHRLIQHALLIGRSRHYETETAAGYFAYSAVLAAHFDPIDEIITETRQAREILLRRGRQQLACYCYVAMVPELLDTAASLDVAETEARAGLMLANRLENHGTRFNMLINLRLIDRLRGGGPAATDELAGLPGRASPVTGYRFHADALAGALLDDGPGLATAAAALEPLQPLMAGLYCHALSDLLLGLDAARQARTPGADRTGLLGRLDTYRQRLAQNAAQAPDNYRHLSALLDAERARLTSDPLSTLRAYEQALDAVAEAGRPWHRALTFEHAAQAHLDLGLRRSGLTLLGQARTAYLNWGATAKVQALDAAHPQLRGTAAPDQDQGRSSNTGLTANSLDMLAILQASQAISSQTDPDGLRTVLVEQLRTLTGAVDVQVLLPADNGDWLLQPDDPGAPGIPVETAGASNLIPLSVFRYVERIRGPLVVADARQDDRFGADGFFARSDHCSLFAVPIVQGGVLRAVLIMTNSRSRGAFTADGRSAVELIAGQLAVSLDNTQLYQSLEAKVLARTHDLESARHQLETLSLTDALTLIGNRRRFDIALQDEWAAHLAAPLTVIMMDIDHFKGYNDLGGHLAGDSCLQSVAAALSAAVRTGDLICRYGGEEFAAILPQTPAEAAFGIAERLRTNVSDLGLPHPAGGIVTVSIGTATSVSRDESGPQAVVAAADRALYRAKEAGRNRVEAG